MGRTRLVGLRQGRPLLLLVSYVGGESARRSAATPRRRVSDGAPTRDGARRDDACQPLSSLRGRTGAHLGGPSRPVHIRSERREDTVGHVRRASSHDVPWSAVQIFQVDERVAPDGDPDRNLTHLRESLGHSDPEVVAMPVEDPDLESAAAAYAKRLPDHFDLVHLGLGPDGHTASLVPGDPVLEVADRLVAVTQPYQGHRRMTLTYPALARADEVLWLISGEDKREALVTVASR